MWSPSSSYGPLPLLLLLTIFASCINATLRPNPRNGSVSALFVFGDSTVDSGNNNFIKTISKSNFPPYGKDLPNHIPTGRFTNGRLATDFLASDLGIKDYVPPYLDPRLTLDDYLTGVCFASAATGFDPLTAKLSGVIAVPNQLKYFKEYKSRIEAKIGKERSRNVISKALFLISAGTNDFVLNYFGPPIRRQTYSISAYQDFLIQIAQQFLQGLLEMGARKIAFVGLPPIGCVPAVITVNSMDAFHHRGCIERLSSVARDYNRLLQIKLKSMQTTYPTAKFVYVDIYNPIHDMVTNPQQFGFDVVNCGCCGSGVIEASFLCNSYSVVCSDDSKYLFWDSVHPTEAAYYQIFLALKSMVDQIL